MSGKMVKYPGSIKVLLCFKCLSLVGYITGSRLYYLGLNGPWGKFNIYPLVLACCRNSITKLC